MALIRELIGALIGSIVSVGIAIGLFYGGIQVAWWLALVLGIVAFLIGGFIAGFISRDPIPGLRAGALMGIIVFGGFFLFMWLVVKAKILGYYDSVSNIDSVIDSLLGWLSIDSTSNLGQVIDAAITDKFSEYGSDIDTFVQKWVPIFTLIISAIFGGAALIVGSITGMIGGRWNKFDELAGK